MGWVGCSTKAISVLSKRKICYKLLQVLSPSQWLALQAGAATGCGPAAAAGGVPVHPGGRAHTGGGEAAGSSNSSSSSSRVSGIDAPHNWRAAPRSMMPTCLPAWLLAINTVPNCHSHALAAWTQAEPGRPCWWCSQPHGGLPLTDPQPPRQRQPVRRLPSHRWLTGGWPGEQKTAWARQSTCPWDCPGCCWA